MRKKVVLCTGISGSGRRNYLNKVQNVFAAARLDLKIYYVGDMMHEKARDRGIKIPEGKILDVPERELTILRGLAFEEILDQVDRHEYNIVATHACFRWKRYLTPAFDMHDLNRLDPDLYVSIINTYDANMRQLAQNPSWEGRLSLGELLIWRDEETAITQILASLRDRAHYLIAEAEPGEILFNLMFIGEHCPKAYLSYPITGIDEEHREKCIGDALAKLRHHMIVFDPLGIKNLRHALAEPVTEPDHEMLEHQTIRRDLQLIDQSDMVIAYYFVPQTSAGVEREMTHGFTTGKEVYVISRSPLGTFSKASCTRQFETFDELIDYLTLHGIITPGECQPPIASKLPFVNSSPDRAA